MLKDQIESALSAVIFQSYVLKIAYFNSANRQLSNDVQPVELRQRKIVDPIRTEP